MAFKKYLSIFLIFSSCSWIPALGPDFVEPEIKDQDNWQLDNSLLKTDQEDKNAWWRVFDDNNLNELISKTLNSSYSYKIAQSKLTQARLNSDIAFSSFLPAVSLDASLAEKDFSANGINGNLANSTVDLYQSGFDAFWEIDIFGGKRRAYRSAESEVKAVELNAKQIGISLISEVIKNYIEYRALEKRLEIAKKNVQTLKEFSELVEVKYRAGISSEVDFSQAEALFKNAQANLPNLDTEKKRRFYHLAVLAGESPLTFKVKDIEINIAQIPEVKNVISIEQPSSLLRNRPDVLAAKNQLIAQNERIGVAIADAFPKFNLIGSFSYESTKSSNLFESASNAWSWGPNVVLPIFQGGKISANIDLQEERTRELLANYQMLVLSALEESQNALNAYAQEIKREESLEQSYKASKRAFELSADLYKDGLIDFIRVIDAQRSLFAAEDALIQSKAQVAVNALAVFKAFAHAPAIEQKTEVSDQSQYPSLDKN